MKVRVGDIISCGYGTGEIIAITEEYCVFVDECTNREYSVDIIHDAIYKFCDDADFILGYSNKLLS